MLAMFKKTKYVFIAVLFFCFFVNLVNAATLENAFKTEAGDPLYNVAEQAGYDATARKVEPIISTVIRTALSLVGVIFLVLMIYAGYLWMTASGNEEQVTKAKSLITASIIGLIIVVSAYAISYFVIETLCSRTLSS